MKVLFINVDAGAGSTGRICVDLARELINNGNNAAIAYGRDCSVEDKDLSYKICTKTDINIHGLISRVFDRSGFGCKKATLKLIKWIESYNPDIIHLHNLHGYYLNVKVLFDFLKTFGKPVVWTLHDCWPFTGHCCYFDYANCSKWKDKCGKCEQKKTYPASFVFDSSRKNFEDKKRIFNQVERLTIVTPSWWLANLVSESFLRNHDVAVIHNGINIDLFKPTNAHFYNKFNFGDKKIILGVANPWTPRKGLKDFIELSKLIDDNYRIFLVGLNQKQIEDLPSNITGIQRTSNIKDLADIYSSSYVFFNPTYEDNYPTTLLEAQACGCPAISYNTGGCLDSVPKQQLVNKGDLNEVLRLIEHGNLIINPDLQLSSKQMCNEYLSLYKKLLA